MWLAPAAMFIESAADSLKTADPMMLQAQTKELETFGYTSDWESLVDGYNLGLQTARMILAGSPQLILKGIKPESIL
jgi:hypothetical protein